MQNIRLYARRAICALTLAFLAILFIFSPSFADGDGGRGGNDGRNNPIGDAIPGELLVGIRASSVPIAQMPPLDPSLGKVIGIQETLRVVRFKLRSGVTEAQATAILQRRPDVTYVEPNYAVHAVGTPDDPDYALQYGPQITQADLAWDIWTPQQQTIVAILDTGVDYTHPDLIAKFLTDAQGIVGYNVFDKSSNAQDVFGHGTHCAGIAAASVNNGIGVAGIAGWNPLNPASQDMVKIMPVKVLSDFGSGSFEGVAEGIVWATDHGASVISMSLGGFFNSQTAANAVRYAISKNVVVVAAAGNSATNFRFYPAGYPNVISVAATDSADTMTFFSNFGSWVRIAAPGLDIHSTLVGGGYGLNSGTSMACPFVAGAATLIRAQYPDLSGDEVSTALTANVDPYIPYDDPAAPGGKRQIAYRAGRLNVYRALVAAKPVPAVISTFFLTTNTVNGFSRVTGILRLDKASRKGGTPVALTYSSTTGLISPPNSVTVPEGQTLTTFPLNTVPVADNAPITITATTGSVSRTASLTINAPALNTVNVNPTTITGGGTATGSVTISAIAPVGGVVVTLVSSDATATVPASVTIPAYSNSVTFPVDVKPVAANLVIAVTATFNGASKAAHFTVIPPDLATFTLTPRFVTGGSSVTGKIVLNAITAVDTTIKLTNTNTAANVPATVVVPAGSDTASFTFDTVSPGSSRVFGSVKATLGSSSRTVSLTVIP